MSKSLNKSTERYCTDFTALEILNAYAKFPPTQDKTKLIPTAWIEADRERKYRHELDGVLVYDSHARINDEEMLKPEAPLDKPGIELDSLSEYDRYQFQNLPPLYRQRNYPQTYHLQTPLLRTLFFNSRFESGNLRKAARVSEDEYNLWLETDYGTLAHTQWYYFKAKSFKAGHVVTFNILNFMKPYSLYCEGLKPLIYSKAAEVRQGANWTRGGERIEYFENTIPKPGGGFYYTLRFKYTFPTADDEVSFAHCFPYTFYDLQTFLAKHVESDCMRIDTLCETLAGNTLPVLTITQEVSTYASWEEETSKLYKSAAGRKLIRMKAQRREATLQKSNQIKGKKTQLHSEKQGVIVTARVHPGESNSSFVMEGFLEFILGSSRTARFLRSRFVFKVVPMLNPDGVIYGNYRTSLLGVDLNRRWRFPSKEVHPEIFYSKRLFEVFREDHKVLLFCDLHGHSAKKNAFMYGCRLRGSNWSVGRSNALIKVFPALMAQHNKAFNLKDCRYRMERSKQSTGRIVVFKELGISNSFTLECSFQGTLQAHFTQENLKQLGASLGRQILALSCPRFFIKKLEKVTRWVNEQQIPESLNTATEEPEEQSDSELDDPSLVDDDWTADLLQLIGDDVLALFNVEDEATDFLEASDDSNSCSSDGEMPRTFSPDQNSFSMEDFSMLKSSVALKNLKHRPSKQRVKEKLIHKSQSIAEVEDGRERREPKLRQMPESKVEPRPIKRKLGTPLTLEKPGTSTGVRKKALLDRVMGNLTKTFDIRAVPMNPSSFRSDLVYTSQIKLSSSFIEQKAPEVTVKTAQATGAFNSSSKVLRPIPSGVRVASINLPNAHPRQTLKGLSSTFKHKRMSQLPSLHRNLRKDSLTVNSFLL